MPEAKKLVAYTQRRFMQLDEQYAGFCTNCNKVTRQDQTEPDAREYPCPRCKQNTCYGMSEALIMGVITIK